jgi:L-ribulokinase
MPLAFYTIGLDYGTNSVRAVVVDTADGRVTGTRVFEYPSGDHGVLLDPKQPHLARQNPADYLEGLRAAVSGALDEAGRDPGFARDRVIGIGVDTTGSTPLPVDAQARPLALDPKWQGNLAAHAWLWKDHTSAAQAAAITEIARTHFPELLAPIGGTYSSEWWWSKIWHCLEIAPDVFDAAASWVELADFIPAVLAGVDDSRTIVRCVCAAGHKAMYSPAWGGLPPKSFLARLDPKLADLRDRLYDEAHPPGRPAGHLSEEWAATLGLRPGIPIAMGGFDAHYGAVGSGVRTGTLVKIIGTSTCDCAIAPVSDAIANVPGICGIVTGSILPDYFGIEAGQSAVGDILNWWVRFCQGDDSLHELLSAHAAKLAPGQSGLIALDWNNGNRTVLVDPKLTGLLIGQTLHTTPAEVYRALIEATAFGARVIIERMRDYGVPIERVVCCGGIAEKNDLFMQIYADVIGQPMLIAGSPQTPALGSAVSAAVTAGAAAGGYDSWTEAQDRMTSLKQKRFDPRQDAKRVYDELYAIYRELHDSFGGVAGAQGNLATVMKRLLDIKAAVNAASDAGGEFEGRSAVGAAASEPRERASGAEGAAKRRASDAGGEFEGRSPSNNE